MGCKQTFVKEEKKILAFFLQTCKWEYLFIFKVKLEDRNYNIINFTENYQFICKNSQNNFKKLEKKQKVRLNFIVEVNKTIFNIEDKEKDE